MEDFHTGGANAADEELQMSVSPVCRRDGKKIAYVSFSGHRRSAEGEIPSCRITSYEGFEEGEVAQLELYMKSRLPELKKMAESVNVLTAFMGSDKK